MPTWYQVFIDAMQTIGLIVLALNMRILIRRSQSHPGTKPKTITTTIDGHVIRTTTENLAQPKGYN